MHAHQYQKQQGNSTAILISSYKFGMFDPQRKTLLIDRQQHRFIAQFLSTQTPVSSTDIRSPLSTEATFLSTNIFHPTSIDTLVQKSIDIEPLDMVATLILVRDEKGDRHDQEDHLRNAAGQMIDAQGAAIPYREFDEFRRITLVSIDARLQTSIDERQPEPIDIFSRASIDGTCRVDHILQCREDHDSRGVRSKTPTSGPALFMSASIDKLTPPSIDKERQTAIDRQPPVPIDRCTPLTYRVQQPKIDIARLNALMPQPKPRETTNTHSGDAAEPMEYTYRTRSDLEESDDFEAFWRYLVKASELTIKHDHRSTLKRNNRSMFNRDIDRRQSAQKPVLSKPT
ncbi:hypothetical protein IGI04_007261 [Brassica rapa subsp. trilocularis]|uniref:Uncharacterized protein n=1 Tax=Brassica rapa subsp. trilocularis TaxID=1813537 RepID=A0ABQ7NJ80_BRACM|nr:hypothetical protein IGI04_007261 [Brassica rapa subsp. trilocularis]